MIYPALGLIASLRAYPAKWGPTVLFLARIGNKLLLLLLDLLVLEIFGRHLGRVVAVLLEEGIEIVLVLLIRRGQMRA